MENYWGPTPLPAEISKRKALLTRNTLLLQHCHLNYVLAQNLLWLKAWNFPLMVEWGMNGLRLVWKYELPGILCTTFVFLVSWLFAAMGNLPDDLNVRQHLTTLFINRNWEQKGSLSLAPMTTPEWMEQAMERWLYKAYVAPLCRISIMLPSPNGEKGPAKMFTPSVHHSEETEW